MSDTREIPLDEAEAGMELAAALHDAAGQVLLPAGVVLTDGHLDSLRRRGIERLTVVQAADPEAIARQREAIRARVMHIFRHTADDPAAQPLLHAVLAFREEQLK